MKILLRKINWNQLLRWEHEGQVVVVNIWIFSGDHSNEFIIHDLDLKIQEKFPANEIWTMDQLTL